MDNYIWCHSSLTGKHKWLDKVGKNKDKLDQCILCGHLKRDLIQKGREQ